MKAEGLTSSIAIHDLRPSNKKMLSPDGANRPKGALITKVIGTASIEEKNAHFLVTS